MLLRIRGFFADRAADRAWKAYRDVDSTIHPFMPQALKDIIVENLEGRLVAARDRSDRIGRKQMRILGDRIEGLGARIDGLVSGFGEFLRRNGSTE